LDDTAATDPLGEELARIHDRRPITELVLVGGDARGSDVRVPTGVPVRRLDAVR
jgi:hypothetical protein